jgi:hypothetical protein
MLLRNLINECTQTVSTLYPEGEAREMVFALFEHILGTRRHTHIIEPAYEVPAEKVDDVLGDVIDVHEVYHLRRALGNYVGDKYFGDYRFGKVAILLILN